MATPKSFDPTPRPALRKSADAGVHPVMADSPRAFDTEHSDLNALNNTSDALDTARTAAKSAGKKKDKQVVVTISLSKSLRKSIKKDAKSRGMSFDELVETILRKNY